RRAGRFHKNFTACKSRRRGRALVPAWASATIRHPVKRTSVMIRVVLPVTLVTAALALPLTLPAEAAGTLTRTFVSSAGLHTNARTVSQPCRTFVGAYAATISGGIISALDPAGYGPLNITGPVTIDGHGWASITAPASGAGITVSADSSDLV